MYKITFFSLFTFVAVFCSAQNKEEICAELDTIVLPILIEPLEIEEYTDSKYIPPVPMRNVFFEFTDSVKRRNCFVFFYCPEMESPDFSYEKNFGSANNTVGYFMPNWEEKNKGYARIPLNEFEGAELLFKASGYKLKRVNIENLPADSILKIRLEPDTTEQFVILGKKSLQNVYMKEPPKYFYGDCRPIYFKDGNHADPICAFQCMGCDPLLNDRQIKSVLNDKAFIKKLYKRVKKGKPYTICLDIKNNKEGQGVVVKGEYPAKDKFKNLLLKMEQTKWQNIETPSQCFRLVFKTEKN